jgi:DNA-binding CsgD family transcriptional regulator
MGHLYLFYTFIAFAIGLISSGIVAFLYIKTKEAIIRYYLFFFTAFTLMAASTLWFSYIYTNVPGLEEDSLEFVGGLSGALAMFASAIFMHFLVSARYARLKNVLIGGSSLAVVNSYPISLYFARVHPLIPQILQAVGYILFLAVFLYISLLGLFRAKCIQEQARQYVTRLFSWILLLLLPIFTLDFLILDDFLGLAPVFFPLLYAGISTIFLVQFVKFYGHSHTTSTAIPSQEISLEDMFERYALSPREQDVARLMLEGRSNQEIGEKLFISLSTVKTHVSNVYQKFSVKNRVEFITFFQNARTDSNLPSSSPANSE